MRWHRRRRLRFPYGIPRVERPAPLKERLILAVVEALGEDDPIVQIALGKNLVEVSWPCDLPEATPHRVADNDLLDFGLWLSEELTGTPISRADLESCLADWATTRGERR